MIHLLIARQSRPKAFCGPPASVCIPFDSMPFVQFQAVRPEENRTDLLTFACPLESNPRVQPLPSIHLLFFPPTALRPSVVRNCLLGRVEWSADKVRAHSPPCLTSVSIAVLASLASRVTAAATDSTLYLRGDHTDFRSKFRIPQEGQYFLTADRQKDTEGYSQSKKISHIHLLFVCQSLK